MVAGSHRESNVNSGLPAALQTALLAALVVILSALVAVVVKNRKKSPRIPAERVLEMGKKPCKNRSFII